LIFFLVGVAFHILALIPFIGILFGLIGFISDIVAFVFLIMVISSL